jgi:tetratricopeptide (TPR) repeat protein
MVLPQDVLDDCFELAGIGRIAEAVELAGRAIRSYPEDGRLWQLCGLLRHRLGDIQGACSALETASLLVPLEPAPRCALAECYARTGHAELAIDLFRELAGDERCPTTLLAAVAAGLGGLGEHHDALEACREIIRRDPEHHQAYFGVAFYLRRIGRPPRAVLPAVLQAHELAPDIPLYRITLAALYDHLGRREEAYDLLCDVDPGVVRCCCCLQRAMAIFRHQGDDERFEAFRARIDPAQEPRRPDA